jgi:CelD/BcsL family acetyltransferase involved in cellulose biosynthesis
MASSHISMNHPQSDRDTNWQLHAACHFERFSAAWDAVNAVAGDVPFLRSRFVGRTLAAFGTGQEVLAVRGPHTDPTALAILERKAAGRWQTFQPSQLPLGAWVMRADLTHAALANELMRLLPGIPLLMAVTQQDPAIHARPADTGAVGTVDYIRTGWIELPDSFEDYWLSRSKSLRQNMRTQRSRLAREGMTASMELVTNAGNVEAVIREYARLESIGWKGKIGTAVDIGTAQGQFYAHVLKDYCNVGGGRLYVYRFNDHVVAVDLNIVSGNCMVLLKTTYDESVQGMSPSSLMREELIRDVIATTDIRRIEFYGPAMEWTYRWTDRVRNLYHVNAYRNSLVRTLRDRLRGPAMKKDH